MEIRTIEHDFEYQIKQVFREMKEDFENQDDYDSFSEWLWYQNQREFGAAVIDRIDEWCGVDELFNELD